MKKSLLSKEYKTKLTEAGGKELLASNTYKHFSNCMMGVGYFGAAEFFLKESKEEAKHFKMISDYVNDRGDVLPVAAIPAPKQDPSTLKEVFEAYYELEKELGDFYNDMYLDCEDATLHTFLIELVNIQRKSIGEAGDFLATIDACGNDKGALLTFDKSLNG